MKTRLFSVMLVALLVLIAIPVMAADPLITVYSTKTVIVAPLLPEQVGMETAGLKWKMYVSLAKMEKGEIVYLPPFGYDPDKDLEYDFEVDTEVRGSGTAIVGTLKHDESHLFDHAGRKVFWARYWASLEDADGNVKAWYAFDTSGKYVAYDDSKNPGNEFVGVPSTGEVFTRDSDWPERD